MKKIILVANVAKEHVLKFHIPTIRRLVEDGWQVDVACGGSEKVPYCHKQIELPIDRSPFKSHFIDAIKQLRQVIASENYDIIYCHTSVGGVVGRIAARPFRKRGLRVIKFAHGTYFYKGAPFINYILYYPLYKYLGSITDDIFTITQEDYVFTQRHYPKAKAHYINGIGVDTFKFQIPDKETVRIHYRKELNIPLNAIVLIYVAELIKNKNQKLLLQMMQMVLKVKPETYLLLVGPEHDGGKTKKIAEDLGISEKVRFLGWRNDIPELLASSDVCTASSIREGLGLNLVEAMSAGLPLVATNNSGHSEILKNDPGVGFLVPFDKEIFANKVIELINNEKLRNLMGNKGVRASEKYDDNTIVSQIVMVLNELLRGETRRYV